MCWLRWPNHIFQEKWHKARSYGTKNCLSKPKLSSLSKANLIFAEQTKTSNTGLAPVRVFREARCIHHHLFPVSARLSASVVPFSEQKVFFYLLGEGRERRGDSLKQGKKAVSCTSHTVKFKPAYYQAGLRRTTKAGVRYVFTPSLGCSDRCKN